MSGAFKIRVLLFLLTLGFGFTALTFNYTFKQDELLSLDAQKIEQNLHNKEVFVKSILNNPVYLDSLKNINNNQEWALKLIPEFLDKRHIYLHTFQNGKLQFWGGNRVLFESDTNIKAGSTFLTWQNGWYETIKKVDGDFSVVAFIPIKANYPYQNQFLQNTFSPDLTSNNNLEIATLTDKQVYNIRNIDGKYLFSVKLRSPVIHTFYSKLELCMWLLAAFFGLICINHLCNWMARKGYVIASILFLASFLTGFRLLELAHPWLHTHFGMEIFNPKYYAASYFFPSIGDLLLNILAFVWLMAYVYKYRHRIKFQGILAFKPFNYVVLTGLIVLVFAVAYYADRMFSDFITNSNISFDVTNILNLSWLSWLSIGIFCLSALCLYLFIQVMYALADTLDISLKERFILFLAIVLAGLSYRIFTVGFNGFFLLFSLLVFFSGWAYYKNREGVNVGVLIFTILIFAVIASLKLSRYEYFKEHESRKLLATKLVSSDDPNAVLLFLNLEQEILQDSFIIDHFKNPIANSKALTNRLQKLYFAGYLSRYEFKAYEYNRKNLKLDSEIFLTNFKNLVLAGSVKVSDYFYRVNNTFGFQTYFALLPIKDGGSVLGTLVIELKSKPLSEISSFPELLVDGKIKENTQLKEYSYAYYSDGRLLNQHGKFIYDLYNHDYIGKLRDFVFLNKTDINGKQYSHLIYQPNKLKLIVISKEISGLIPRLAAVSFIFLTLLLFASLIVVFLWFWSGFANYSFTFRHFRWKYMLSSRRLLYKTRIQVSMVATVVLTLLITGFITYYNISQQYRQQQEEGILDKVNKISAGLDKTLFSDGKFIGGEQAELSFNNFAEMNGIDLNLFDVKGNLILSTQPKIYENGLIARKMAPLAYMYLNTLQKAECINHEAIGLCSFITAYVPLRNGKNEAIAYLGLPYFSNEKDFQERIGVFINALVNVYALVFVAIGFFAVFVANRITGPLTLIQKSLSQTKIGQRNEPIVWQRNDEIGNLIKEYNNMIAALEESAQKLARSERETAWREMAKQVAHEIKNPLTPLKLGVQLLEKAWREKDENFDRKFERFSKSFVEQIESLAHIASEFSNFAKMPDTVLEKVNLADIIKQSINLYRQFDQTDIIFKNTTAPNLFIKGDKDQLLRCFNNLIKNAIEARVEGRKSLIKIDMHNSEHNLFVEIHDNGSGIAESLRPRIFTPNFTTKSSGTGLGLAFVKQAIGNMNGNISYKTEEGLGTTFYITIPLAEED